MLIISGDVLNLVLLVLLYAPAALLIWRYMTPRLSSTGRRAAAAMLLLQLLIFAVAAIWRPAEGYERWFWHLDREFNFPSAVASAQLALVGMVALLTAWFDKSKPVWQRLYLVGVSAVFFHMGRDEYYRFHEFTPDWDSHYAELGAALVIATAAVALRSARRAWLWHGCFLIGLAMSAAGAILVERLPTQTPVRICEELGPLRLEPCLLTYQFEEALEFLGVWLVLVAMLGHFSEALPKPARYIRRFTLLSPLLWAVLILRPTPVSYLEYQLLSEQARLQFQSEVEIEAYRVEQDADAVSLHLFWTAGRRDEPELGFSLRLIDQVSGEAIASVDQIVRRRAWSFGFERRNRYVERLVLDLPAAAPRGRALWLLLTHWQTVEGAYLFQKVLSSDLHTLDDSQIVMGELALPLEPATAAAAPLAEFSNGFALMAADLPGQAEAGAPLPIRFSWRSEAEGGEDLAQFLHFGHEASGEWLVYDQQPLGPRLPTRLWYAGLADSETWQAPLPVDLAPGRYQVFTGLYRMRDKERLPARDAAGEAFADARVPLGSLIIE